jgi:hypothetical protein
MNSCLASRQFVHPCRKYIFYTLPSFGGSTRLINELLLANSSLSGYVRKVQLVLGQEVDFTFLRHLTRVEHFAFEFGLSERWSALSADQRSSLVSFVKNNRIVSLSISKINFGTIALLSHFDSLRSLTTSQIRLSILISKTFSLSQLTHLSIRVVDTEVDKLPEFLELPKGLQYLKLDLRSTLICCSLL